MPAPAQAYLGVLYTPEAQDIVEHSCYRPRIEAAAKKYAAQFAKVELLTTDRHFGGWQKAQAKHFVDGALVDQIYQPR